MRDTSRWGETLTMPKRRRKDEGESSPKVIARRLRALRKAYGAIQVPPVRISQTDFAEHAGLTQNAYTNYENALRAPSIEAAAKLAHTYGLTLDWIFLGDDSSIGFRLKDEIKRSLSETS